MLKAYLITLTYSIIFHECFAWMTFKHFVPINACLMCTQPLLIVFGSCLNVINICLFIVYMLITIRRKPNWGIIIIGLESLWVCLVIFTPILFTILITIQIHKYLFIHTSYICHIIYVY